MKNLKVVVVASFAFSVMGCAMAQAPVTGLLYTDVVAGVGATEAYGGSARGEACVSSILGAVALGDASIDAAKKNGGIAQVTAVDHTSKSIIGVYAKYCTVVYGKKAALSPAATGKPKG